MQQVGRVYPPLDPEVEDVLAQLVEQARTLERAERHFFVTFTDSTMAALVGGAGIQGWLEIPPQDLNELAERGLIRVERTPRSSSFQFHVTSHGQDYYREIQERGEPLEQVQEAAVRFLDAAAFSSAHPEAYSKWKQAYSLYASDPIGNATRIGHDCHEALMAFASSLSAVPGVEVEARPEQTVARLRAVIDARRAVLGERTAAFLDALLAYWGTVSDLAQRQEHAASREGEKLTTDDSRRVVWYTALVMQELQRAL